MGVLLRVGVLAALLVPLTDHAQSMEKGQAICFQIERFINTLVDYTHTSCVPMFGTEKRAFSFALISTKPVLSVEAAKKGWIISAVGSAGEILNRNPSLKVDQLFLSDVERMKSRVAYMVSANVVKSLQRRIKADQIGIEAMYSEVSKNMTRQVAPK